jgi:hypothetical protein
VTAAIEALDGRIAVRGDGWVFVALVAALLGLRHAADPDHLTAVLSLRLRDGQRAPHRLGLAWGAGHALTMVVIGVPLILFASELPARVQQGLEVAVGVIICALALRVLWGLVSLHAHAHRHPDGVVHAHPHVHGTGAHTHRVRSARDAFALGLLHGAAGSAGVTALMLTRLDDPLMACIALVIIAAFCALAMSRCSWAVCRGLDRCERRLNARWIAGIGGAASLCFGVVYALSAAGVAA